MGEIPDAIVAVLRRDPAQPVRSERILKG